MHQPLPDEELDAIERRCSAALPGPWQSIIEGRDMTSGSSFIMTGSDDLYLSTGGPAVSYADHDFIAAARQDVPRLLAEVRRLRQLLEQR
ncbi:MAG: hypothetical protein ABMA25_23300 [Ilumatobacteraceae bacterium]